VTHELYRKPAVAGSFYPDTEDALRFMVDGFLEESGVNPAKEGVASIVVPHAGYVYSGSTAACAFQRVSGSNIERVILLGCSHHFSFDGASIVTSGEFETPLGTFPIDDEFATRLAADTLTADAEPHVPEHALEVELPFLAIAVGLVPIVPILFGSRFGPWHREFAGMLAEMTSDTDLVIASSDLSHYLTESQANTIDHATLDTLLTQDVDNFAQGVDTGRCSVCSLAAVGTAMTYSLARGADQWTLLDHCTSARASGDVTRVVGYAAVSMESA